MKQALKLAAAISALTLALLSVAFAEDEFNVSSGITTAGAPLGLHGVDAVALSTANDVLEGKAKHTVVVDGAAYYFSSAATARQFEAAPQEYLPQYGGFCAFAVALGKKFDGDPRYADIFDGKLYLFVNEEIFEKYKKNSRRILAKAEAKWPEIRHTAVKDLR